MDLHPGTHTQKEEELERSVHIARHIVTALIFFVLTLVSWYAYSQLESFHQQEIDTLEQENAEVLDQLADAEMEAAEAQATSREGDVVFNTEYGFDGFDQATTVLYQTGGLFDDADVCPTLYEVIPEEGYAFGGMTAEGLETDEFATYLDTYFSEFESRDTMLNYLDGLFEQGQVIQSFCLLEGQVLVKAMAEGIGFVYGWHDTETSVGGYLKSYQPVPGIADGAMGIKQLEDGTVFVATGYGDAGTIWWKYYRLDQETSTSDLVESCKLTPSERVKDALVEGDYILRCAREYQP